MSEDWSISPPLPDKVFPWEKYNPVTREEVNEFFHSPEILVIKERMCDIGRRLWNREYVDGNGGNISVRVAQNLLLCSPTLCSKGFMTVEDICMVDMDARQKAGIRPSTSEVKTHIAMMKSVGVNACIHAHPPHCNAFLFAGQVPPSGINPEADIFLGHIPLAPYGTPGSLETARAVAEAARQSTVVFMENHGVITGARDVEEAEWFMENADAYCRMVLMAGLQGSGKTTSLYAGLGTLNDGERNILTIEDPVEYAIRGIGQTQVNSRVGMSFAAGLRAILRQDPDVVMVGEIRDAETAQIAVQASLTGHLVLSTVHTNDAAGAITRLRDIGVEPFLIASSLRLVLAQRLVRRLCPHCRQPADGNTAAGLMPGADGLPLKAPFVAAGCASCRHTGYLGRIGIHEAIEVDERIRRAIAEDAGEDAIAALAFAQGGRLSDAARQCVAAGITTVEEALRVTRQEGQGHAGV